jgi:hypothetical protein
LQHLELTQGEFGKGLLDCDDVVAEVREAHDVTAKALRQGSNYLGRPGL